MDLIDRKKYPITHKIVGIGFRVLKIEFLVFKYLCWVILWVYVVGLALLPVWLICGALGLQCGSVELWMGWGYVLWGRPFA